MEIVVEVDGNDEAKLEESVVDTQSSSLHLPKQIADPVVYKLVRVQGDGTLVPATDDELMEVEDLLKVDKSEIIFAQCIQKEEECTKIGGPSLREPFSEGLLQSEEAEVDENQLNARLKENCPTDPGMSETLINQSVCLGECSKPPYDVGESSSAVAAVCDSSKPDFSMLSGEICLDNLSIRELHETFRATFGRETTVKDKQWLKRRIAIGLNNSCDVSTTTFVIKNNKLIKKGKLDSFIGAYGVSPDIEVEAVKDGCIDSSISHNEVEEQQNVMGTKVENPSVEYDCPSDDFNAEQRAAKRIRKPTKRYIEELSEVEPKEFGGREISSAKGSGHVQEPPKFRETSVKNLSSHGRVIETRLDSFGGSGVQVPFVSRVRRSRPRKNVMALMKCDPSSAEMAAVLVKKSFGMNDSQSDNLCGSGLLKAKSSKDDRQSLIAQEKNAVWSAIGMVKEEQNLAGDSSDDNAVTMSTAKGGIKRKHHRPWTLSEVMKLVEGVSRYGAGRWSEIKRIAFASDTYRTSVDLKDKWRNLLRASFAQTPPDKGINSRKQAPAPIPATILIRVRELAEMHAQVPPILSSSKTASCRGRSVNEIKSGYL